MATPVLIIGKSGSGKSTSLRNCQNKNWNLIRVLNKPLPGYAWMSSLAVWMVLPHSLEETTN